MKHNTYFSTFLKDVVNLNQGRIDTLVGRVDTVYAAMRADSDIGEIVLAKIPQGSWPHRTIIRPRSGGLFDADFLLHLEWVEDWASNPSEYPNAVYRALDHHTTYKTMDHGRRARAVYLNYAPVDGIGCHLDIVPYVHHPLYGHVIIDRDTNAWEPTNPQGFTDWFKRMDTATNGNFRKVVRLMKYYKVYKGSFDGVRSVILTTLLGNQIDEYATAVDPTAYADVPSTLVALVTRLDQYLRTNTYKPSVTNPGGDGTTFDHRWTQETYANFAARMATAATNMKIAIDTTDPGDSIKAWQAVFGDRFTPSTTSSNSTKFAPSVGAGALGAVKGHSGKGG